MYQLKRIVVCIDLSSNDEDIVRYSSVVADLVDADTVYFLHVAKDLNLPEEITRKNPEMLAPVDETIKHEVRITVEQYFGKNETTETHIDILEGKPTDLLLKYAKRKNVDLIIMDKHIDSAKSKVNPGKIAELSHCSVLFVPAGSNRKIEKVMVAADFSDHSKLAFEQALHIQEQNDDLTIYGIHVYTVPNGYHKTGKSYEEFAEIMKGHAQKDAVEFFEKHDIDRSLCEMRYLLSEDDKIHDELNQFAMEKKVDIILIGSQGRTRAASLLLGSIAENILRYENNIPVFIVKEKNSNMSFFEAILKI